MVFYWGWVVCLCFLLVFTLSVGIAFSYNEIIIPLSKEIHSSMTVLDLLGSVPSSLPMLLAPISTILYYKIGTRKVFIIGVVINSLALAFTALTDHVVIMFVLYGIIGGSAMTLIVNPPFFLLDKYFPYNHKRHVLATSVIACAFPLGTLIFNPIAFALISSIGWRGTYSVLAASMFILGGLTALTLRTPNDAELAQIQDNIDTCKDRQQYEGAIESNVCLGMRTKVILAGIWTTASFCKGIGYYTPYLTLVKQMDVLGISQTKATVTMVVIGVFELISRIITSYAGDYVKGKMLCIYVIFCAILSFQNALATMATKYEHFIVYAVGLGIFGGPIIAAMYSSCSEVLQGQYVPEVFTAFRVGLGFGCLTGPLLSGAVFDATQTFYVVYIISSLTYCCSGIMYFLIFILNKYQPTCIFPEVNLEKIAICNMESKPDEVISKKGED